MSDIPLSEESVLIHNAVLVLPDRLVERGALLLDGGVIREVACHPYDIAGTAAREVDARGAYAMPGLIDLHNDGLETEINPRPEADLPLEFALSNMERRLLPFGVTTEFHALAFMEMPRNRRTVKGAELRARHIAARQDSGQALVEHQILHRLDVWSPASLDALFASVERAPVKYISLNDHTPGQGQYRDLDGYLERMAAWTAARGGTRPGREETVARIAARGADTETLPLVYNRVRAERKRLPLVVASHDDDSAEKVDLLYEVGARVAEFPVTLDAARRARERGMTIVVGAPNIVRGGSASGNQDARELFALGLADVICADYHPPSLLHAAFRLVEDGLLDLPAAIRTLTLNAARAVGMESAGALRPGLRADVILVQERGGLPVVEAVFRAGREVFSLAAARAA